MINIKLKQSGHLLWIGHLEYLPALILKLKDIQLPQPVLILTDLENYEEMQPLLKTKITLAGGQWSEEISSTGKIKLCGLEIEQWSAERQENELLECKAVFDAKEDDFTHNLKPPTKAQKYILNNIPFAIDSYTYSYEYFNKLGLKIPDISNVDSWLSEKYFDDILNFTKKNYEKHTLKYISKKYIDIAKELHNPTNKVNYFFYYKYLTLDALSNLTAYFMYTIKKIYSLSLFLTSH